MAGPITQLPTTLEQLVRAEQEALATLTGMLTGGVGGIYPRAGVDPGADTPGLFLVNRFTGESGSLLTIATWSTWVYDDPSQRYWRIADTINILRRHFDQLWLPPVQDGYQHYYRVQVQGVSGQQIDEGWGKYTQAIRFSVWGG